MSNFSQYVFVEAIDLVGARLPDDRLRYRNDFNKIISNRFRGNMYSTGRVPDFKKKFCSSF